MSDYSISASAAQQMLEVVTEAVLVNSQGKYSVFVDLAGHVNSLWVRVLPASHDWNTAVSTDEYKSAHIIDRAVNLETPGSHIQLETIAGELAQLRDASELIGGSHG